MGLCEGQRFDKSERTLIFKDTEAHGVKIKSFVTLCLFVRISANQAGTSCAS